MAAGQRQLALGIAQVHRSPCRLEEAVFMASCGGEGGKRYKKNAEKYIPVMSREYTR